MRVVAFRVAVAVVALAATDSRAGVEPDLFADGFESPPVPACVAGPESGVALGGVPPGDATTLLCFELREDAGVARTGEAAYGAVPVARAANLRDADLARLVVLGPGGRHLPAQFRPIARWGAPLADTVAPILWLGVALVPDMPANATTTFALQRYAVAPVVADPGALTILSAGGRFVVDTGLAELTFDPTHATLVDRIEIRATAGGPQTVVYQYAADTPGHGFDFAVARPDGAPLLAAGNGLAGTLAVDAFEWVEAGPVRAVAHLRGHAVSGTAADTCYGSPAFQVDVTIAATRGSRDLDFDWHFVTACGDASGGNLADESVRVDALGFGLVLDVGAAATRTPVTAGNGAPALQAPNTAQRFRVHQRRGGGAPWARRAEVRNETTATTLESAETFASPLAGLAGDAAIATLQMPWLKFREPQALDVQGDRVAFRLVSEPSVVGEAKGLWFAGRLSLAPAGDAAATLAALRARGRAALERGLVPRARVADLDASGVLPPLAGAGPSNFRAAYEDYVGRLHDQLVRDVPCTDNEAFAGGQWTCAKTFGSQLWPDILDNVEFAFQEFADPSQTFPRHDYWGAHHAELVEFLRSGDPKWTWEFAFPQVRLQAHTAYLNVGRRDDTNRNGYAPSSGGVGDGLWHRNDGGSADYSYNMGFGLAYALRPDAALRDRFARMGAAAMNRFTNGGDVESWIAIARLNVQYLRGLLYCAMFVPGAEGTACDGFLRGALDHLAANSIQSGVFCETKLTADANCAFGQAFMGVALFQPFLDEVHRVYGPGLPPATRAALRRALVQIPRVYRQYGVPSLPGGGPDVNADWASTLACTLTGAGFTTVAGCAPAPAPEPFLFQPNKPAATNWWFRSHALDATNGLCAEGRAIVDALFTGATTLGPLVTYSRGGWSKASSQDAQSLAYAVAGYETCGP